MINKIKKIGKDNNKRVLLRLGIVGDSGKHEFVDIESLANKINEIIDFLPEQEKYPLKSGEKTMYAVLGVGGAIYGFSLSMDKAEETRDKCWNIGKRKPEKYIISFRKV